jgi:release factor glutamine methyltransferase
LRLSRTQLMARQDRILTTAESTELALLVERRLRGAPIAYLVGRRNFMDLALEVGPGVLNPRPETELLVEWSIDFLRHNGFSLRLLVDVGTGSGAIALSIAATISDPFLHIVGSDISPDALKWAARNRQQLGLTNRVDLVRGDLLSWLGVPASLIIANLPYLRPDQVQGNWEISEEPRIALVSGDEGLDSIRRLLTDANRVLSSHG